MPTEKRLAFFSRRRIANAVLLASAGLFVGLTQAASPVLSNVGAGGFGTASGNATGGPELRKDYDTPSPDPFITAAPAATGVATVDSAPPGILGAAGLNHFDNRTADGGNNFSVEPPDQGLCVGNGYVLEAVNLVVGLRDAATNTRIPGTIVGLNTFFGLPFAIQRPPLPLRFGPFLSDPKCLYDNDTKRFFVTVLEIDQNPVTRAFTGPTAVLIAVSKTSNPLDGFRIFSLNTTNDGSPGTAGSNPGCPCYGDQPLIGTDDNGLYISTNEFPVFVGGFNGAQIYGISKQKLAAAASSGSGASIPVGYINAGAIPVPPADAAVGGIWYTVQPAVTPPNKPGNDGTSNRMKGIEYFLSALEFSGIPDNRVAIWALTNTDSLQSVPDLKIHLDIVTTNTAYVSPPRSTQRPSAATPAPRKIDGGDDRMQQVVMVDNTLYGSLTTAIGTGASALSGVAYWGIKPSWPKGVLKGSVRVEGMVSVDGNFLQRPSIALNHQGKGVIAFSLIGPDYFPSAAYIGFHKQQGAQGSVYIAGAGVAPDIGFSGAGGGRQRWGDYSAGVDEAGAIWVAAEYIPIDVFPAPAQLANWGTYVWRVRP